MFIVVSYFICPHLLKEIGELGFDSFSFEDDFTLGEIFIGSMIMVNCKESNNESKHL